MKKILLFILIAFGLSAQDWFRISGDYAVVEYQENFRDIADSLLTIAEISLPRIAQMCGLPPKAFEDEKTHIILTDAPDISNGFALNDQIVIYATSSAYIANWTGHIGWYHQVLTHELVHNVTFRKMRRKLYYLGNISYLTIPRWFLEGTAQYFSENWNTYRGDLYVKNAVLSGKFNLNSLYNMENGRLLYASAHAFTRYLAEQYGDSSLIKLMSYKPDAFYYDFSAAFKKTYGKNIETIFKSFTRHLILHYGDTWSGYPVFDHGKKLPSFGFKDIQVIPLSDSDSTYLVSTRLKNNHLYNTVFIAKKDSDGVHFLKTISYHYDTNLILNPDKTKIAFGRYAYATRDNLRALSFNWYIYDIKKEKTTCIASNIRARYGAFTPEDELILAHVHAQGSDFYRFNAQGQKAKLVTSTMPVGFLSADQQGNIIFSAQRNNGNRDLFLLKRGEILALTNDRTDDRRAFVMNDSLLIFSRFHDGNPGLALLNINSNEISMVLNDQYEYWPHYYDNDQQTLIAARMTDTNKSELVALHIDSLLNNHNMDFTVSRNMKYAQWKNKKPVADVINLPDTTVAARNVSVLKLPQMKMQHMMSFALPSYDQHLGAGIYGFTTWMEALQRQFLLATFLWFPEDFGNSFFTLAHTIKFFNSDLSTVYYHGPVVFSFENGDWIESTRDIFAIQAAKRIYLDGNNRLSLVPALAINLESLDHSETGLDYNLTGANANLGIRYFLPTRLYPLLPKRELEINIGATKIFDKVYDYTVYEFNFRAAANIALENLGIKNRFSYIRKSGALPANHPLGIDRYYQYDIPRDIGYTRTIRGYARDMNGKSLLWNSGELIFIVARRTPLKLLVIPINNLMMCAFMDYAGIQRNSFREIMGYGIETGFGPLNFRLNAGLAFSKSDSDGDDDKSFYVRLQFIIPE